MYSAPESPPPSPPEGGAWHKVANIFGAVAGAVLAMIALPLERAVAGIFLVISALGLVTLAMPWRLKALHNTMTVLMAALLGGTGGILLLGRAETPDPPPTTTITTAAAGSSASAPSPATSPVNRTLANGDELTIQVGQCVRNIGNEDSPVYKIAECQPGTQRVLARIDQAVTTEEEADALCQKAAPKSTDYHYTNWDQRPDYINAVLCFA